MMEIYHIIKKRNSLNEKKITYMILMQKFGISIEKRLLIMNKRTNRKKNSKY